LQSIDSLFGGLAQVSFFQYGKGSKGKKWKI